MPTWTSEMRAAETSTLSATGSRSLPRVVTWPRRRAISPSSQSVRAAAGEQDGRHQSVGGLVRDEEGDDQWDETDAADGQLCR